jgi:hypothetical protein
MFIHILLKFKNGLVPTSDFEPAALVPVLALALKDREPRVRQVKLFPGRYQMFPERCEMFPELY